MTAKGEATKTRILDAATDQLIAGGVNRLNLDDVLATTKTSKGQLFHYFPGGKAELSQAATIRQAERLAVVGDPDLIAMLSTLDGWRAWFDAIVALHREQAEGDACELAALAGRTLDSDAPARAVIARLFEQWSDQLSERLESMRDHGALRPETPVAPLATLILAAVEGGAVIDKATGSTRGVSDALDQAYALLRSYAV